MKKPNAIIVAADTKLFSFYEKNVTVYDVAKHFVHVRSFQLEAPVLCVAVRADKKQVAVLTSEGTMKFIHISPFLVRTEHPDFGLEVFTDSVEICYSDNDTKIIVTGEEMRYEYIFSEDPDEDGYYDFMGRREKLPKDRRFFDKTLVPVYTMEGKAHFLPLSMFSDPIYRVGFEMKQEKISEPPLYGYYDRDRDNILLNYADGTARVFSPFYDSTELIMEITSSSPLLLQEAVLSPCSEDILAKYQSGNGILFHHGVETVSSEMDAYAFISERFFAYCDAFGIHICDLVKHTEPYQLPLSKIKGNFCGLWAIENDQ